MADRQMLWNGMPIKILDNGDGTYSLASKSGSVAESEVTPTLTVHSSYALGDYVGTSGTPMEFANISPVAAGAIKLESAELIDHAVRNASFELWLFNAAPTPPADSAAWVLSDADIDKCVYVVQFNVWFWTANNGISCVDLAKTIKLPAATTSLWGCLVVRSAPAGDWADGDLTVRLTASRV